jgi:hypothetical protein
VFNLSRFNQSAFHKDKACLTKRSQDTERVLLEKMMARHLDWAHWTAIKLGGSFQES